jgi:hypothetical protein
MVIAFFRMNSATRLGGGGGAACRGLPPGRLLPIKLVSTVAVTLELVAQHVLHALREAIGISYYIGRK